MFKHPLLSRLTTIVILFIISLPAPSVRECGGTSVVPSGEQVYPYMHTRRAFVDLGVPFHRWYISLLSSEHHVFLMHWYV